MDPLFGVYLTMIIGTALWCFGVGSLSGIAVLWQGTDCKAVTFPPTPQHRVALYCFPADACEMRRVEIWAIKLVRLTSKIHSATSNITDSIASPSAQTPLTLRVYSSPSSTLSCASSGTLFSQSS